MRIRTRFCTCSQESRSLSKYFDQIPSRAQASYARAASCVSSARRSWRMFFRAPQGDRLGVRRPASASPDHLASGVVRALEQAFVRAAIVRHDALDVRGGLADLIAPLDLIDGAIPVTVLAALSAHVALGRAAHGAVRVGEAVPAVLHQALIRVLERGDDTDASSTLEVWPLIPGVGRCRICCFVCSCV